MGQERPKINLAPAWLASINSNDLIRLLERYVQVGSAKANGRYPKTCLGQVFNYKLVCFNDGHVFFYVDARPHL